MASPEPSYPTTAIPKYSSTDEGQEEGHKTNFMNMAEVTKEVNKSFQNIKEKTNVKEMSKFIVENEEK